MNVNSQPRNRDTKKDHGRHRGLCARTSGCRCRGPTEQHPRWTTRPGPTHTCARVTAWRARRKYGASLCTPQRLSIPCPTLSLHHLGARQLGGRSRAGGTNVWARRRRGAAVAGGWRRSEIREPTELTGRGAESTEPRVLLCGACAVMCCYPFRGGAAGDGEKNYRSARAGIETYTDES
jgi:hypothetical protein